MNDKMHDVKTKFHSYVSFGTTPFDTTPDADDNEGFIVLPAVTLDGEFTFNDLAMITKEMKQYIERLKAKKIKPPFKYPLKFDD